MIMYYVLHTKLQLYRDHKTMCSIDFTDPKEIFVKVKSNTKWIT